MSDHYWHNLSQDKIFSLLKTSLRGLTTEEVMARQVEYGLNILPDKKKLGALFIFYDCRGSIPDLNIFL